MSKKLKKFLLMNVGIVLMSVGIYFFKIPISCPVSDQPFLELVYAMMLTAIGSEIIFYCEASYCCTNTKKVHLA